ncbi:MAG: gliding motility-associated C-terminal domain-containing protein, partial [Bacteroidota bacterium]
NQGVSQVRMFRIFDRWGEMVFEAQNFQPNNPVFGWNGMLKGKPLNPAVFVYFAEVEFVDGVSIMYKGDVTLVK